MTALRIERIDATRASVSGHLGFAEASAALARGEELYGSAGAAVGVDLVELEGIDSATLAVLLAWAARAAAAGTQLRFAHAPTDLAALAHLCDAEPLLGLGPGLGGAG